MKKLLLTTFLTVASCLVADAQTIYPYPFAQSSVIPNVGNRLLVGTDANGVDSSTPLLLLNSVYSTNNIPINTSFTIAGSTVPDVNGLYTLSTSNYDTQPRIVWTNATATYIVYCNDPGANVTGLVGDPSGIVIESIPNDPNALYWDGPPDIFNRPVPDSWVEITAPADTLLTGGYTTNSIITSFNYSVVTNTPLWTFNTNIVVDQVNGNDTFGAKGKVAFRTFHAAVATARTGDHVWLNGGYYDENAFVTTVPNDIIIHGNNSSIRSTITLTDGDMLYDLTVLSSGIHFNLTNALKSTFVKNCLFNGYGSGDGVDIDACKGLLEIDNSTFASGWDNCIIDGMGTNGVIRFRDVHMISTNGYNGTISSGSKGIGWLVNSSGGTIELYGGSMTVLNPTNRVFTGIDNNANSCFLINYKNGQSTYGNASVRIYGTAINYGTTNASVLVSGISNVVGMPIYGYYMSNNIGSALSIPYTHSTHVILNR